jgi:Bifunctional DNA primase/polymerase, N-terminal/D5 N terminal like
MLAYKDSIADDCNLEQVSLARRASGLSQLPIALDGSKSPLGKLLPLIGDVQRKETKPSWIPFQTWIVLPDQLRAWVNAGAGIGIIGGQISGNLEIIDIDAPKLCQLWRDMLEELMPGLLDRLPCVLTPKQGWHVYYRCSVVEGNQKLAQTAKGETWIETRGEGGYVVAPGSPLNCHPLKKPYQLIRGDLTQIPTISPDERTILLNAARSFNERPQHKVHSSKATTTKGDRAGDDYNQRVSWKTFMESIGCTETGHRGNATLWKRPDKTTPGHSAITGNGDDMLYVFSSNFSPFQSETAYDRFGAYATWFHGGDFTAAAAALYQQGYGNGQPHVSEEHEPAYHTSEARDDQPKNPPDDEEIPIHLTDRGNALRLIKAHGKNLHYIYRWKKWLVWDGTRWVIDEGNLVERLAKRVITQLYRDLP